MRAGYGEPVQVEGQTAFQGFDLKGCVQSLHFDMNGWRTLKFFFYLTPVSDADGPHRCIPGTHRRRPLRHQL